jgi:hypothetical protein
VKMVVVVVLLLFGCCCSYVEGAQHGDASIPAVACVWVLVHWWCILTYTHVVFVYMLLYP